MEFEVSNLGLIDFKAAWEYQRKLFEEIKNNHSQGALIVCRHYPVITIGRGGKQKNILATSAELNQKGVRLYEVERGGDVTYHGPGQILVYPVLHLEYFKKDIHLFLRQLEELAISFLSCFGIRALRHKGLTGVWIDKKKIASIGIAIRNWITFHGMSINIKNYDLENFKLVRPCGMDIELTSLEEALHRNLEIECIQDKFIRFLKENFILALNGVTVA